MSGIVYSKVKKKLSKDQEKEDVEDDIVEILIDRIENGTQTRFHGGRSGASLLSSSKQITPRQRQKKKCEISEHSVDLNSIRFMDWKRYHRLGVVYAFLDELERDFPAICTICVIGKSVEGRDIKMIKVSNSDASNKGVWLDGSIHPREWISTSVVTFIANTLVRNFHMFPDCITNKDWHIVPVLNPDGYEYTHVKDRMWRKNRACYGGNRVGVDLNRNFSYGWGNNGDEGSSDEPSNVFYRGPCPFSEPETMAVRDYIMGSSTKFSVFISFHSYFEMIIFPWGHKPEPCPDYLNLLEGGISMAKAIQKSSGKTYKVGSTKDLTYVACGTSTDWSYAIAKIPFSYMVELRSKKHKFKLPKDQILETCTENWEAVKSLMKYVELKKDSSIG